MTQKKSLF